MRAGCVWERRRRRHLLCPPRLPLICTVHIPSGPNLSPLSSRTPQPQISPAWQPALSQPVITHKSFHALKENFYAVLRASCAPALAASPVPSWAPHPTADALPRPCCPLQPRGAPAALSTPPLHCPGKAPQIPVCLCCHYIQPWAHPGGSHHCGPQRCGAPPATVRLIKS